MSEYGHYTSIAGLMGIIEHEQLWATNIRFLNDEQEYQHALDLIKELLPTSKLKNWQPKNEVHRDFLKDLEKKVEQMSWYTSDDVYTLSFTQETDLLSQWRGYCPGNNGYCIVFDVDKLFEAVKREYENSYCIKCVYDAKEKEERLRKLLNGCWSQYLTATDKKQRRAVLDNVEKEIRLLGSQFKDSSFEEEKEHRIVIISDYGPDDNRLKFREGRFSVIPYVEVPASRKLIQKIFIGPTAHKAAARRSLALLLEKHIGMPFELQGGKSIEFSKTPYRPW